MTNTGIKMQGLVMMIAILMAVPTLAFADILGNRDRDILKAGGTITRVAPNWRIVCMRKGGEPYGVASRHKHCRLEKNDFRVLALMTKDGSDNSLSSIASGLRKLSRQHAGRLAAHRQPAAAGKDCRIVPWHDLRQALSNAVAPVPADD